jgi:hypothetical protein
VIKVTRIGDPDTGRLFYAIARENHSPENWLSKRKATERLTELGVDDACRLVEQAAQFGVVIIHEHG